MKKSESNINVQNINAVVYVRARTEKMMMEQDVFIRAWANEHIPSAKIIETYKAQPGSTGLISNKTLQQLLYDAMEHKFDVIITSDIQRICRNLIEAVAVSRFLKQINPPVEILTTQDTASCISFDTP